MKCKFLVIAGVLLVPLTPAVVWIAQPSNSISAANFDRIEVGMSESEVVLLLGPRDPGDEDIQREDQGDWRSDVKCWSRPSRGTIRDTILVCFRFQDGQWIVENKYCFIPSHRERVKAWWGGYEILPDRLLPHQAPAGRAKRLESAA
jgi:hypothetical protein